MKCKATLFLHGGPSSSAKAERLWLGQLDDIDWWDQPRANSNTPWLQLLGAAERKLDECVEAYGGPVHLLTSSLGCEIATYLARSTPGKVRSLVMLAPVFDVGAGFAALGEAQLGCHHSEELSKALAAYRAAPSVEALWPLIGRIFAAPRIFERYWGPAGHAKINEFVSLVGQVDMFDPQSFQVTLNDFLATGADAAGTYTGPVTVVLGDADPFLPINVATLAVQNRFPQAKFRTVNAGHFPHLEVAASLWDPAQLHLIP